MATTIRNPGVLPLTLLGLDGARTSQPNPYVASIVGLGWVPQPTDRLDHVLIGEGRGRLGFVARHRRPW